METRSRAWQSSILWSGAGAGGGDLPAGAITALPGRVLRDDNRATGIGIFATGSYIGLTFLPPIAGGLLDRTGDPTLPLYFAAAISLATAALVIPFRAASRGEPSGRRGR